MTMPPKQNTHTLPHQILTGTTWHARHTPAKHSFSYPYRYWGLSLNSLAQGDLPTEASVWDGSQPHSLKRHSLKRYGLKKRLGTLFTAKSKGLHSVNFTDYVDIEQLDTTNADNAKYKQAQTATKKAKQAQLKTQKEQAKAWLLQVKQQFKRLAGSEPTGDILALVVSRNLGFYFSPVNFYIGFDIDGNASHLLAEVSNTPWNKRHFYGFLLTGDNSQFSHNKDFHVSPFNPLDQTYTWKIKVCDASFNNTSSNKTDVTTATTNNTTSQCVGLKNIKLSIQVSDSRGKVFEAGINMKAKAMTTTNLRKTICKNPIMNYSSMGRIYWHALLLYVMKKVPYVGYNQTLKNSKQQQ